VEPALTDTINGARRRVVLAGPGVVQAGPDAVAGLRAFAAAANIGVANTWGAKGLFAWDSPYHLGTCGLQARDFELLGFGDVELIITTGIDIDESPPARYALAPTVDVPPQDLHALARVVTVNESPIRPSALYERIAAIVQPGYEATGVPLHPARAVADARAALPAGGRVSAEPGPVGLWMARAFPTTELGSVFVPAQRAPGVGLARACEDARAGRVAIAMTHAPLAGETQRSLDECARDDIALAVIVWDDAAPRLAVDAYRAAIATALGTQGVTRIDVPVDLTVTRELIAIAGPVVAWGGSD
jgi:thiamine pyrophosphate-dependent acetolactate synthase large subunit-like protein